jgi:hypothetical protein
MTPEQRDARGRVFVPETSDVVAGTKLLETGQSESLRIPPIRTEGIYEYVCTFPGHWVIMFGQIVVTKDVDAYLKANPPAAAKTASVTPATSGATAAHAHMSH